MAAPFCHLPLIYHKCLHGDLIHDHNSKILPQCSVYRVSIHPRNWSAVVTIAMRSSNGTRNALTCVFLVQRTNCVAILVRLHSAKLLRAFSYENWQIRSPVAIFLSCRCQSTFLPSSTLWSKWLTNKYNKTTDMFPALK